MRRICSLATRGNVFCKHGFKTSAVSLQHTVPSVHGLTGIIPLDLLSSEEQMMKDTGKIFFHFLGVYMIMNNRIPEGN